MSNYNSYQSGTGYYSNQTASMVPRAGLHLGLLGALVGGVSAAAKTIPQVRQSAMTGKEAAVEVLKESAGSGLATAAGAVAVGVLSLGGALSVVTMFSVATGVKCIWDSAVDGSPKALASAPAADAVEESKTVKTAKTAKK